MRNTEVARGPCSECEWGNMEIWGAWFWQHTPEIAWLKKITLVKWCSLFWFQLLLHIILRSSRHTICAISPIWRTHCNVDLFNRNSGEFWGDFLFLFMDKLQWNGESTVVLMESCGPREHGSIAFTHSPLYFNFFPVLHVLKGKVLY